MPSLNQLMCGNTTLVIVLSHTLRGQPLNPPVPGQVRRPVPPPRAQIVVDGRCNGRQFIFDFVSADFQIMPVRFQPHPMTGSERQKRDASIALFQNQTLLTELNGLHFNLGVEQDAVILDNGALHDLRRGRDSSHSPDRANPPTQAVPPGRRFFGYFHTHPYSSSIRPPTPSSDWNVVPGVGVPGVDSVLHFMIESNKRIWGLSQNRRAFIVGVIDQGQLLTMDPASNAFSSCWALS